MKTAGYVGRRTDLKFASLASAVARRGAVQFLRRARDPQVVEFG